MKKLNLLTVVLAVNLIFLLSACITNHQAELSPIIDARGDVVKAFYPSTNDIPCAVVVTKSGDVYYYRLNGFGQLRDVNKMFNVQDFRGINK